MTHADHRDGHSRTSSSTQLPYRDRVGDDRRARHVRVHTVCSVSVCFNTHYGHRNRHLRRCATHCSPPPRSHMSSSKNVPVWLMKVPLNLKINRTHETDHIWDGQRARQVSCLFQTGAVSICFETPNSRKSVASCPMSCSRFSSAFECYHSHMLEVSYPHFQRPEIADKPDMYINKLVTAATLCYRPRVSLAVQPPHRPL